MSFTIRLSQDLTAVEAGATVPLSVELTNKGEEEDRYEMQVEGIDPEWTALPEPTFVVGSHEIHSQKVFFRPPRSSESLAGNYPFVVRVRSLNSGDSRTAQGVLQIKPFNHLSMEITPKKGYSSPMRQLNRFTLTIMNLGNTEHTLQLTGADPDEECTYDFGVDQVSVGPGQQKDVEVTVNAGRSSLVAGGKLFGFAITARSIENPNIMATTQGQLEQRPLMSGSALVIVLIILGLLVGWYAVRPQPPTISLQASDSNVLPGQTVHIHWKAANANSVDLEILKYRDNKVVDTIPEKDLPIEGTKDLETSPGEDSITVRATAVAENRTKDIGPIFINIRKPPPTTKPVILDFKASTQRVKLGESVLFSFSYSPDVTKITLAPTNQEIAPPLKEIQIKPDQTGTIQYHLIAYNAQQNYTESKKISVEVYQASDAVILDFSAQPPNVDAPDNKTVVRWSVTNAAQVQFDDGTGKGLQNEDLVNTTGVEVQVDKTITLTLIATDQRGISVKKKLTVKYKPLPPPTNPFGTTSGPPPTTGGGGTATGGGR